MQASWSAEVKIQDGPSTNGTENENYYEKNIYIYIYVYNEYIRDCFEIT